MVSLSLDTPELAAKYDVVGQRQFSHGSSAEDLSAFAASSFDIVYLNSVIHWIADKPRALAEIHRVLRPGGRLGFTTAAKDKPHDVELIRQRSLQAARLAERAASSDGIPHKVTSAETRQLLERGGFRVKQLEVRTIVDYQASAADVHEASLSSSFGNSHLGGLSDEERDRVHAIFATELEQRRDAKGIRLEHHLIFAVGEKVEAS